MPLGGELWRDCGEAMGLCPVSEKQCVMRQLLDMRELRLLGNQSLKKSFESS